MPIKDICPKGHVKTGHGRKRKLASGEIRQYPVCLICRRDDKQKYQNLHPEKVRKSNRATKLKLKYGIAPSEYDALLDVQGGRCWICRAEPTGKPLSIDHKGKNIRGLLCDRCNFAAGLLADSPDRAERLALYLRGIGVTTLIPRGEPMRITIESTTKEVWINGIKTRIWEGRTDSGIPCHCYITRIAVDRDEDSAEFESELQEHRPPSPEIQAIPLRLVL